MKHRRHKQFFDRLPKLNHLSRRAVAVILPWFSLGLGMVQVISAVALWNLLGSQQTALGLSASLEEYYTGQPIGLSAANKAAIYICVGALALSAALFIGAVGGLRARRRYAWRMVLAAMLIDLISGVGQLAIYGRTFGDVLSSVVKTTLLLYLLAQVHSHFEERRGSKRHKAVHHAAPHHAPAAHKHAHPNHNPHIRVG